VARMGSMGAAWAVLDEAVDSYEPVFDSLEDTLEQLEQAVFARGSEQSARIYLLLRDVGRLGRALHPLLGPMETLERGNRPEVPRHLRALFRDVGDHVQRLYEEVTQLAQILDGLLNANLAAISVRQNVVVQKLSAWAAIAVVPTVITGVYGMNFHRMPELG